MHQQRMTSVWASKRPMPEAPRHMLSGSDGPCRGPQALTLGTSNPRRQSNRQSNRQNNKRTNQTNIQEIISAEPGHPLQFPHSGPGPGPVIQDSPLPTPPHRVLCVSFAKSWRSLLLWCCCKGIAEVLCVGVVAKSWFRSWFGSYAKPWWSLMCLRRCKVWVWVLRRSCEKSWWIPELWCWLLHGNMSLLKNR